jgi:hypothetical protein
MAMPYSWTAAFERALNENDATQLHDRVLEAEDAIMERSVDLSQVDRSLDDVAELEAMRLATSGLLKIKVEKLGWPDFRR